ncbi:MAG: hypothetical protein CMJ83_06560 [Planctomycetes bacterium]|jgi:hypothetical protein|nr:hypothetical protein [Planctomycetota bacterium]
MIRQITRARTFGALVLLAAAMLAPGLSAQNRKQGYPQMRSVRQYKQPRIVGRTTPGRPVNRAPARRVYRAPARPTNQAPARPWKDPRASAYRGFQNQNRATAYRGFQNRDRQTAYRGFQNQNRATAYRGFQNQGRATAYRRNGVSTYVVSPNRRPSTSGTYNPRRGVTTGHWSNQRITGAQARNRYNYPKGQVPQPRSAPVRRFSVPRGSNVNRWQRK